MLYLVFTWFTVWSLIRVIKSEPAVTIVVVLGWLVALLLLFGVPHFRGGS